MPEVVVFGISFGFPELSRCDGQIAHVLLTRSPLVRSEEHTSELQSRRDLHSFPTRRSSDLLRPATRRSLGGPLPHQLADRPRAHPSPPELSTTIRCLRWSYSVLASVSRSYPDVMGRLLTCYSPVRRS